MALNKERKVLLGLLGSAGLILVVDQVLLGPPQGARASGAQPPPATPPTTTVPASAAAEQSRTTAASTPTEAVDASGWNARLVALADEPEAQASPDPFASQPPERTPEPEGLDAARFAAEHRLTAVVTGGAVGAVGVAMVNGRPIRVGESVAGYRLVRVDARSAEFRWGDETVRLELPTQTPGGS